MATSFYGYLPPEPSNSQLDFPSPPITANELNLRVLQRHLPSTVSIEFLAPYAVVYKFSTAAQAWEKSGIEGTLFVAKLRDGEGHAVVVLNRRGMDNFVLRLKSAEEVDVTPEYIILQGNNGEENTGDGDSGGQEAYGLWIFEEEFGSTRGIREACGRCIVECAENAEKEHNVENVGGESNGDAQQQPSVGAPSGPDLMALLNPPKFK